MTRLIIDSDALKHDVTPDEIRSAVLYNFGSAEIEPTKKRYADIPIRVFVGPRHEGGSKHNAIEVLVALRRDHTFHAFHAMPVSDIFRHLLDENDA